MSVCGNLHSLSSFFEGSFVIGINCGLKKAIISQNKARSCGHFSYGGGALAIFDFGSAINFNLSTISCHHNVIS